MLHRHLALEMAFLTGQHASVVLWELQASGWRQVPHDHRIESSEAGLHARARRLALLAMHLVACN